FAAGAPPAQPALVALSAVGEGGVLTNVQGATHACAAHRCVVPRLGREAGIARDPCTIFRMVFLLTRGVDREVLAEQRIALARPATVGGHQHALARAVTAREWAAAAACAASDCSAAAGCAAAASRASRAGPAVAAGRSADTT